MPSPVISFGADSVELELDDELIVDMQHVVLLDDVMKTMIASGARPSNLDTASRALRCVAYTRNQALHHLVEKVVEQQAKANRAAARSD